MKAEETRVDRFAGAFRAEQSVTEEEVYAAARSLALAVAAVVALLIRSISYLEAIALAMVVVQAADTIIGLKIHDRLKTIGPALTSLTNALALFWLYASS